MQNVEAKIRKEFNFCLNGISTEINNNLNDSASEDAPVKTIHGHDWVYEHICGLKLSWHSLNDCNCHDDDL